METCAVPLRDMCSKKRRLSKNHEEMPVLKLLRKDPQLPIEYSQLERRYLDNMKPVTDKSKGTCVDNDDDSRLKRPKSPRKSSRRDQRTRSKVRKEERPTEERTSEDTEVKRILEIAEKEGKVSFSHRVISNGLIRKVASALRSLPTKKKLKKFKVQNCGVGSEFITTLLLNMDARKVDLLNLSGNKNLDLLIIEELREKLQSEELDFSDTELNRREIKNLGEMKQVKKLKLNYKAFSHGPIAASLAKLINNGLEELSLVNSKLTDQQLEKISEQLVDGVSLKVLDLAHVPLKEKGGNAVARIVNKTNGMTRLALSDCAISVHFLRSFKKLVEGTILDLDISFNQQLADGNIEVVSALADKVGCEAIDLSGISLDGTKMKQLMEIKPSQIQQLCLGENLSIDVRAVGQLAENWKLSGLDVSECRLSQSQIFELANSIGNHKLCHINVSDPMAVTTEERQKALKTLRDKATTL